MKNIFCLIVVLFASMSNAQNSYETGYYVDNSGATKTGLIENEYWYHYPTEIHFKTDGQSAATTIGINNVKSFGIGDNVKFIREVVNIDNKKTAIFNENNSTNANPSFEKKTVFLKVLAEGAATLCSIVYNERPVYFFSLSGSNEFTQLFYRTYADNEGREQSNNAYRIQLFDSLKCEALSSPDFRNLRYDEKSIITVINKYNSCKNIESKIYKEKERKAELKFSAGAGMGLFSFTGEGTENSYKKSNGTTLILGGEVSLLLPYKNKRIEFFAAPYFEQVDAEIFSEKTYTGSTNTYIMETLVSDFKVFNIDFGGRYYFIVNEKGRIFLATAATIGFANGSLRYSKDRYTAVGVENINEAKLDVGSVFGFKIGMGYLFNQKISVNLDYDVLSKNVASSNTYITSAKYNVLAATIKYRLN